MTVGDMLVGEIPPAKLAKALAVIADRLHPSFEADGRFKPGISKRSCVLTSLTVREFLFEIGFLDAQVVPVCAIVWATKQGVEVHSLGIGHPSNFERADGWNGHMVVTAQGFLIETTLYQAGRPHWADLPGMVALPLATDRGREIHGMPVLAGISLLDDAGLEVCAAWVDRPGNSSWRRGPDAIDRARRTPIVGALIEGFGKWE